MRINLQSSLLLVCLGTAFPASAQSGAPAPLFPGLPFERWLAEGGRPQIRWTTRVAAPELSIHQRLQAKVEIQVDGDELIKRRGHGQLVTFVGLEDSEKHVYRTRQTIDLQNVEDAAGKSNINVSQAFFVIPGDYQVSLGVFDASNGEHSVTQRMLHVPPLRGDPLPEAWKDLPPVEVAEDPPDDLFLPSLTGRLHLPLENRHPIHIELLVNTSRSTAGIGPRAGQMTASTLGQVIPAMKVISQIAVHDGTVGVAVLDLARHKAIFEQEDARILDWPTLRGALTDADPNVIDVHALENRKQDAHFFVTQVSRRIESGSVTDAPHVIIILSGPMSFASGADLHPIEAANTANTRIYYLRYHPPPVRPTPAESFEAATRGRRTRNDPLARPPLPQNETLDSLANTVKPLHPHLFDIYSPEQFRKALSTVLDEVSRL